MIRIIDWIVVIIAVLGLIGIRAVEDNIFYDPFLEYFHEANKNAKMPSFEWGKLILNYFFRFGLNLFFSAVIVYFIFKRKDWTIQAIVLIFLVFIITFPIYLYCVSTNFEVGYLFSFYMRRFVIQPLLLLLIVPMFYYRKNLELKNN